MAVNLTESQLRAGRAWLAAAGARPVVGDAVRLPVATDAADGLLSVEAAFHFASRRQFLAEARRVLRPGGTLAMSDVTVERIPRDPAALLAGLTNVRFWGIDPRRGLISSAGLAALLREVGFREVRVERVGHRTIDPYCDVLVARLRRERAAPWAHRAAARVLMAQWRLLRRRGAIDYVLVRARAPVA